MVKLLVLLLFSGFWTNAQPTLKGGLETFVSNNLVYPPFSLQNCIQGTVLIGFKLNSAGDVQVATIQRGIGTDLDDEALRLIRISSGKWIVPENHDSTTLIIVPMNFKLSNQDCGSRSPAELRQSIAAYQAEKNATNAVLNFYRKKEEGKYSKEEEEKVIALKNSLGYSEAYLEQRLESGKRKLKQKDLQGACEDFKFIKYMGSDLADDYLEKYCP